MFIAITDEAEFGARCRSLNALINAGQKMSLGDMADYLGLPWSTFAAALANEAAEQLPGAIILVEAPEVETKH